MPSLAETAEYFDRNSDRLVPDALVDKWQAILPMFRDLPPNARILECGAGTGLYTIPMLQAKYDVCSVDLSQNCLDVLENRCRELGLAENLATFCGEFNTAAPRIDQKFDAVTFIKVLHHFPDACSICEALAIAYSLLKPCGRLIGFEPNGACPFWYVALRLLSSKEMWENERNYLLVRRRLFESVFRELHEAQWYFAYRYFIPGCFTKKASFLDAFDRLLVEVPLISRFSGNICFVVTKKDES